jgi:replication-associated recombination protein RarA
MVAKYQHELDNMGRSLRTDPANQSVNISPVVSLQEFVVSHRNGDASKVADSNLREAADGIIDTFLLRKDAKQRSMIIYGEPNSGKTTMCVMLKQIFHTEEYQAVPGSSF